MINELPQDLRINNQDVYPGAGGYLQTPPAWASLGNIFNRSPYFSKEKNSYGFGEYSKMAIDILLGLLILKLVKETIMKGN